MARRAPEATPEMSAQFWSHVTRTATCWIWTGDLSPKGYGRVTIAGVAYQAHRVSYEWAVGLIPDGLQLDHVKTRGCTNRSCVNPAHLEPVTPRENTMRGDTIPARNVAKTHCPADHPYDEANTRIDAKRRRNCRACHRERTRLLQRRKRAATKGLQP